MLYYKKYVSCCSKINELFWYYLKLSLISTSQVAHSSHTWKLLSATPSSKSTKRRKRSKRRRIRRVRSRNKSAMDQTYTDTHTCKRKVSCMHIRRMYQPTRQLFLSTDAAPLLGALVFFCSLLDSVRVFRCFLGILVIHMEQ